MEVANGGWATCCARRQTARVADRRDSVSGSGIRLGGGSGARAAVPGAFTTLASSSEPLTAVTTDPTTGIVYAQGNQTQDFFKYDPATDTWSPLAKAPIEAENDGGAAI